MKKYILLLIFLTSSTVIAQSYTEKWNDLYNRYEYFNSKGNMTGYKYYDNLNRVWKYKDLSESTESTYVDPINTELVRKTLVAKDSKYNTNVQKVQVAIDKIYERINNLDTSYETRKKISDKMNFHIQSLQGKKYDYSNSSTVNSIINWLYDTYNKVATTEISKTQTTSENSLQPSTYDASVRIGSYITTGELTYIWDIPNMVKAKNIGYEKTGKFLLLEKTNTDFYKVKSGDIIGYIYIVNVTIRAYR